VFVKCLTPSGLACGESGQRRGVDRSNPASLRPLRIAKVPGPTWIRTEDNGRKSAARHEDGRER
jgi:hypothetical protein